MARQSATGGGAPRRGAGRTPQGRTASWCETYRAGVVVCRTHGRVALGRGAREHHAAGAAFGAPRRPGAHGRWPHRRRVQPSSARKVCQGGSTRALLPFMPRRAILRWGANYRACAARRGSSSPWRRPLRRLRRAARKPTSRVRRHLPQSHGACERGARGARSRALGGRAWCRAAWQAARAGSRAHQQALLLRTAD